MEEYRETPVLALADALIAGLGEKNNNITVVKHYNTFEITNQDAARIQSAHPDLNVFYYLFSGSDMIPAWEPFLTVIRELYHRYYRQLTPKEYIDTFPVYSLHRSILSSLMDNTICSRPEEILLDEVGYERRQMLQSLLQILLQLSREHPFMLVMNNLNMAAQSTISLLTELLACEENSHILVLAAYNDLQPVLPHMTGIWEECTGKLEDYNCTLDGGTTENAVLFDQEQGSTFQFESSRIWEYLTKLNNMLYLLDIEQARYYLNIIYSKIEIEKLSIGETSAFRLFLLYEQISLYGDDLPNALLLCDSLKAIRRKSSDFETNYYCYFVLGQAQMYNGKLRIARDCAEICVRLARDEGNDLFLFRAQMLLYMVRMSGWHNIFFCKSDTRVPEEFLQRTRDFGYQNHLAYLYVYAFDNNIKLFDKLEEVDHRLTHFEKGIAIAKELGNECLLMQAYRKNIMLSSANGLFAVSNHYYYKSMEIAGEQDSEERAAIYNGLGYNSCTAEEYEKADDYYNRAIEIYYRLGQMNFVGETLYNMAINCILAGCYKNAYEYLQSCMRIVNTLHLNDLRVCNISKIFGLLALCAYRLGLRYNCRIYLDNAMQFLSHILNRDGEGEGGELDLSYTACDDDIFLYYYVEALLQMDEGNLERACQHMETAQIYVERSVGNQFFSKVQFLLSFAELKERMGQSEEASELLQQGIEYAKGNNASEKLKRLTAVLTGEEYQERSYPLALKSVALEDIQNATKQAGLVKNHVALKRQMEFLSVWQKMLDISGKSMRNLISNALNTFMANFSIDVMLYLRYSEGDPVVVFDTKPAPLTSPQLDVITDYFSRYHSGFVTSKLRKNHVECNRIVSLFGVNKVCSMICLPYYVDEQLDSVFIMYINMKDNWNSPIVKYMLDESEFNLFNLMLRQLLDSVKMLENGEEIHRINKELEESAIKDYLTGAYNRSGFYGRIQKMLSGSGKEKLDLSFLYVDLDNFKYYNDSFGHDVGDMLLQEVADILREVVGENGFVTRFGGDEFLLTLFGANEEAAVATGHAILEKMRSRKAFTEEIKKITGRQVTIPAHRELTCSAGIALATQVCSEEQINRAVSQADEILYDIKRSTKGDVRISKKEIQKYKMDDVFFKKAAESAADFSAGIILPDGDYVLATEGHLEMLLQLSETPREELWEHIPKEDSALFWMIAHTGCVITDSNSSVGLKMNDKQEATFKALVEHGLIADKYFDISRERERAAETNSIQTKSEML